MLECSELETHKFYWSELCGVSAVDEQFQQVHSCDLKWRNDQIKKATAIVIIIIIIIIIHLLASINAIQFCGRCSSSEVPFWGKYVQSYPHH